MTGVACRLDWLSVNMIDPYKPDNSWEDNADFHSNFIFDTFGIQLDAGIHPGRQWQHTSLRGSDCALFYGGDSGMTFEIGGKACAYLHASQRLQAVVLKALEVGNVTRLDIAVDMETDTDPRDFVEQRSNKRQKSVETAVSSTGTTCYIGSRKSDRYARVYRYNDPHPRADLLRCEMVFRGKHADIAARQWLAVGDEELAARAGNIYGWEHPDFAPKARR